MVHRIVQVLNVGATDAEYVSHADLVQRCDQIID
jgi:hypothetical protein